MTEKPILFSAPMIRAILEGRKSMTRRIVKPQPPADVTSAGNYSSSVEGITNRWTWLTGDPRDCDTWEERGDFRLPYAVGDDLWVRETITRFDKGTCDQRVQYVADGAWNFPDHTEADATDPTRYAVPSIFMPRWASRITLRVTAVKVERLQDISEEDAKAEGVAPLSSGRFFCGHDEEGEITAKSPITAFAWLWNSIHGPDAWSANPWVMAVSFERVKP